MNLPEIFSGTVYVQVLAFITVATPVILALVQVVKQWVANSRWYPIISIAIGIILGFFFGPLSLSVNILIGVLSGLSASGLYSGSSAVKNG